MAEITPIQMNSNGAVTFEKTEALAPEKVPVKGKCVSSSGVQCTDQVMFSQPVKNKTKKTYFTKPPTPQQIEENRKIT